MKYFSIDYAEKLLREYIIPFAGDLAIAIVVFLAGRFIAKLLRRAIDKMTRKANVDKSLRKFIVDLSYAFMLVIVAIAALERLGVKTTAAVAVLGAAGLAVGLALQGSLGNFAAGVMIILLRPYRVGDLVSVAGHTGSVEAITIFNTVLVTPDNRQIAVPNGQAIGGAIENKTTRGTLRIDLEIGVGYGDDLKKTKSVLESILNEDSRILKDPAPQVAVCELADSSVNFVVRPWVEAKDYWDVRFDTIEKIKVKLDENNISIPFPQRDLHIYKETDSRLSAA